MESYNHNSTHYFKRDGTRQQTAPQYHTQFIRGPHTASMVPSVVCAFPGRIPPRSMPTPPPPPPPLSSASRTLRSRLPMGFPVPFIPAAQLRPIPVASITRSRCNLRSQTLELFVQNVEFRGEFSIGPTKRFRRAQIKGSLVLWSRGSITPLSRVMLLCNPRAGSGKVAAPSSFICNQLCYILFFNFFGVASILPKAHDKLTMIMNPSISCPFVG